MTRRFFILLAVCIAVALCGMLWSPAVTVARWLASALAVCAIFDAFCVLLASRRLRVSRSHADLFSLGQPNPVTVDISLRLPQRLVSWLRVVAYDTLPRSAALIGDEEMRGCGVWHYSVVPSARGRHELGVVRCFVRSRWPGLCEVRRFVDPHSSFRVYPTFRQLEQLESMALTTTPQGQKRVRWPGNNTEFEQIRPYIEGDDPRTVNWRATARARSLMVNTYTSEHSLQIIPVVCAGESMLIATDGVSLLDRATSAAVALGASAVRHYDDAGLITVTHAGIDSYLRPQRSASTVPRMLECLCEFGLPPTDSEQWLVEDPDVIVDDADPVALHDIQRRLEACRADADYDALAAFVETTVRRRSLLVLFANFENIEVARQAVPALRRIAARHALIVVLFENEGASSVAKAPYLSDGPVSQKLSEMRFRSVCAHYIEQQQMLAQQLRACHIHVVLTPPNALSAAVLNKYLELKNRAKI